MRKDIRLYITDNLSLNSVLTLSSDHSHYLQNMMRCRIQDELLVFNDSDGKWKSQVIEINKKLTTIRINQQIRHSESLTDIMLIFGIIKSAALHNIIRMATELGIRHLQSTITQYTMAGNININRLNRIAIEAVEQCGRLSVPAINKAKSLDEILSNWSEDRSLILCDETKNEYDVMSMLSKILKKKHAIIIGPESGFSCEELQRIGEFAYTSRISLGPRILRADTATTAAISYVQLLLGDHKCK